jgi:hypothetical protein
MSEAPEAGKKVQPWHWPGQWVREESFWRDVATRTASGLLVVILVYAYGLAVGYFRTPQVVVQVLAYMGFGGLILFQLVLLVMSLLHNKLSNKYEPVLKRIRWALAISGVLMFPSMLILITSGGFGSGPGSSPEDPLLGF